MEENMKLKDNLPQSKRGRSSNNKTYNWFTKAKQIVKQPEHKYLILSCSNDEELVNYINYELPEEERIAYTTAKQKKHNVDTFKQNQQMQEFNIEFAEWFNIQRKKQELYIADKMNTMGNTLWNREAWILKNRFGKRWNEKNQVELSGELKHSISLAEKLKNLDIEEIEEEI